MKKLTVAIVIIGLFIIYSLTYHQSSQAALAPTTTTDPRSTTSTPLLSSGSTATGGTPAPGTSSAHYKDGSYTGSVADAQWGYIQVKAIIQNSKITDVQFLQYPNERSRSIYINQYADPQLTTEAIQAQSAQVDIVTGATDSSMAFMQSLSDALSHAQG
jgi:uncharacterized protein with FMN-binding domain